jgi:hypothetical protein
MANGSNPATKQDLEAARSELKADIEAVKVNVEMVRSELHHVHDALVERIADSETKLLKAFYTFAESNQTRLASIETESEAVKKRVGILEDRMLHLERKVNFPNQPPQ